MPRRRHSPGACPHVWKLQPGATLIGFKLVVQGMPVGPRADGVALGDEDAQGRFRVAQYGPVYQLGGRLNEMMLTVRV